MERICDVNESFKVLNPVFGLFDNISTDLLTAIQPLKRIVKYIEDFALSSIEFSRNVHGFDGRLVSAINLYTRESDLYKILNESLRSEQRERLAPFIPYLGLLLYALCSLPKEKQYSGSVWRGVKKCAQEYKIGKKFFWWGFSSCTTKLSVLENEIFLGKTGVRTLFRIQCKQGFDIKEFSIIEEEEILLLPGRYLEVVDILNQGELSIVELNELDPPFQPLNKIHTIGTPKKFPIIIQEPTPIPCPNDKIGCYLVIEPTHSKSYIHTMPTFESFSPLHNILFLPQTTVNIYLTLQNCVHISDATAYLWTNMDSQENEWKAIKMDHFKSLMGYMTWKISVSPITIGIWKYTAFIMKPISNEWKFWPKSFGDDGTLQVFSNFVKLKNRSSNCYMSVQDIFLNTLPTGYTIWEIVLAEEEFFYIKQRNRYVKGDNKRCFVHLEKINNNFMDFQWKIIVKQIGCVAFQNRNSGLFINLFGGGREGRDDIWMWDNDLEDSQWVIENF